MLIRKYNPTTDHNIIEPMMVDYFEESDSRVISQGYDAHKEIAELLERKGDIYVMINKANNGEIVGFHRGEVRNFNEVYRSSGVYLLPTYRGIYLGSKLSTHQESVAKEKGCYMIQTLVRAGNEKGLALAKRNGFNTDDFSIVNMRYNIYKTLR